ncbi:MAG: hypothetical protein IH623_28880 [Verrucomicrobia bacterium]|nr:hypothetical protein [Verrucomicrobiota bacterium]
MNIEPGKTARRLGTLMPTPNAKLRVPFHEVCSIAGSLTSCVLVLLPVRKDLAGLTIHTLNRRA